MGREERDCYGLSMVGLQGEYGPAACQSGLRGRGRVSEVEACLEAVAQRLVPQQRLASCQTAAYKKTHFSGFQRIRNPHDGSAFNDSLTRAPVIKPGTTEGTALVGRLDIFPFYFNFL